MSVLDTLTIRLEGDASHYAKTLDQAESTAKGWGGKMGGILQGAAMGVGLGMVNMAANAAGAVVGFASDSIGAASDMGETISKVGQLFGPAQDAVVQWSSNAATALGQSQQQALDAASTFAIMGKAAGLSGTDLQGFSTDFVGLASDLASFNNTTPEAAVQAIGAALRGEAEPLRAYGVLLDDASMRNEALKLGLISTTKEALTPQQKVLAAQSLIYAQTGAAQGDFARTSDGLANQQRILAAQMENVKATVGQALLPIMLKLTTAFNEIVQRVLPPLSDFFIQKIIPAMEQFSGVVGNVIGTVQGWLAKLKGSVNTDAVAPFGYFKTWIDENMPRIQHIIEVVLGAIMRFWEEHGATVMRVVNNALENVRIVFDTVTKTIMDVVTVFLQLLTGDWEGAGETLKGIVTRIWEAVKTIFFNQIDSIKAIFQDFDWGQIGRNILDGIRDGIVRAAVALIQTVQDIGQRVLDALKWVLGIHSPSAEAAAQIGVPLAQGIGVGLRKGISAVGGQLQGAVDSLLGDVNLSPSLAMGGAGGATGPMTITVYMNGNGTYESGRAVGRGVLDELRQAGVMA